MLQSHCVRSATMLQSPPYVVPMMANDGLRCKHHCDRFGWTHGRHQVHSAHTNLHTAFSTTEVSEISCIHRKDAPSTKCSHKHAYCILYDWGRVRCMHRKDALSTQCSPKPVYYHWQELPQVSFLSQQKFCGDKHIFCQNICHDKHLNICHDRSFVTPKI